MYSYFSKKREASGEGPSKRLKSLGEQFQSDEDDDGEADDRQPLTASRDTAAVVVPAITSVNGTGEQAPLQTPVKRIILQSVFSRLSQCFVKFSCISCEGLQYQPMSQGNFLKHHLQIKTLRQK